MGTIAETFDAKGVLVSRAYYDDAGQPVTAGAFAAANANKATVAAALAQALTDLDAVLAAAAVPATVTSVAQAQAAVRAIQVHVGNMALHLKRAIRYVTGDFTGTN
jgi:hypothetical protein